MIIDGKAIAQEVLNEIKAATSELTGRKPCLAVILVGEDPASKIYVNSKARACEKTGIHSIQRKLPADITQEELLQQIEQLNADPEVDGILVQLPVPDHINPSVITSCIDPAKDVDGFHPFNVGKILLGERDGFLPCTPHGICKLLEKSGVTTCGKHVLIIGRSNIVGKPMAALLIQNCPEGNATVTIANSHTKNLKELALIADIIIAAIGKPHFVTADMVKEGATVIDVGMNRIEDPSAPKGTRVVGDVDFENVKDKCHLITPVPGGVGPMTIAMLLQNTLESYRNREGLA